MIRLIGFFAVMTALCLSTTSFIFQSANVFVQFRVLSIPDAESAQKLDEKIGSKSGIIESRTDHVTSTYFCLMSAEAEYTKEDFVTWFGKLGYEISCFNRGIQHVDVIVSPHVLKSCEEQKQ